MEPPTYTMLGSFGSTASAPTLLASNPIVNRFSQFRCLFGMVVGTFQYMSPEQVEGKEVDGRSDLFSLGAVLYEMLTGRRAFEGKSQLSIASAILEKEPAPISAVKPMTPPALDRAIRTCLEKDPEKRWQAARDLTHELEWIAGDGSRAGLTGSRTGAGR